MKKLSIKTRVTIWYAFFLVLLVSLIFISLFYTSDRLIQENIKGDLTAAVDDSIQDVKIENGSLEIDDDLLSYRDGIYVLVYRENNFIVTGSLPAGITEEIPFISDQVRIVENNEREYYVYDHLISDDTFADVWIRGITSADLADSDPAVALMLKFFFISLPLLILVAAVGGYYITKRAFRPVSQITETAVHIQESSDLSQRIHLETGGQTKDEI